MWSSVSILEGTKRLRIPIVTSKGTSKHRACSSSDMNWVYSRNGKTISGRRLWFGLSGLVIVVAENSRRNHRSQSYNNWNTRESSGDFGKYHLWTSVKTFNGIHEKPIVKRVRLEHFSNWTWSDGWKKLSRMNDCALQRCWLKVCTNVTRVDACRVRRTSCKTCVKRRKWIFTGKSFHSEKTGQIVDSSGV